MSDRRPLDEIVHELIVKLLDKGILSDEDVREIIFREKVQLRK